jgi:hypothetical protein
LASVVWVPFASVHVLKSDSCSLRGSSADTAGAASIVGMGVFDGRLSNGSTISPFRR